MKYRYVLKNIHTGEIHFKWYTIKQIEDSGLKGLFDVENYEILHRDRFTGLKDKNEKEIYERGKYDWKHEKGYITFIRGSFKCTSFKEESISFALESMIEDIEITGNIHK